MKFIIYDSEETIFYRNEFFLQLSENFKEVCNLIANSYSYTTIDVDTDRNTGWVFIDDSWEFDRGMWEENKKIDLTLNDYLENSNNDNIWIITIF